jgi:hypothetical protein
LIISSFYKQRVSVALQKAQATTILHQAVVAGGERERPLLSLVSFEVERESCGRRRERGLF